MRMVIGTLVNALVPLIIAMSLSSGLNASIEDDEKGLLRRAEKQEQLIRTSSLRVKDPDVEASLTQIVCLISPPDCNDLSVYALRTPGFNAFVMPNGAIFVQTGLLLRVQNESELGAVLAHEIIHYRNKHTIQAIRRASDTGAVFAVLGAGIGAAGSVAASTATSPTSAMNAANMTNSSLLMLQSAQVIAGMALISFSREDEVESDTEGARLMSAAGYSSGAGAQLWKNYVEEDDASGGDAAWSMLSTHPAPSSRVKYMEELGAQLSTSETAPSSGIFSLINHHRLDWLKMEMKVLHPNQFDFLISKQSALWNLADADVNYMRARSWLRYSDRQTTSGSSKKRAIEKALTVFSAAHADNKSLTAAGYREWGMLADKNGDSATARIALEQYLHMTPNAWDAAMMRKKIDGL